MERQTSTPGPEIGWAFGLAGFVVSTTVGWLIGAGVGFVLFMVVLWGGLGALFAFLVERSSMEERDRVEELRNVRLATLGTLSPAVEPLRDAGEPVVAEARETVEERRARRAAARRASDELAAAHAARMATGAPVAEPAASTATRPDDAPVRDVAAA